MQKDNSRPPSTHPPATKCTQLFAGIHDWTAGGPCFVGGGGANVSPSLDDDSDRADDGVSGSTSTCLPLPLIVLSMLAVPLLQFSWQERTA